MILSNIPLALRRLTRGAVFSLAVIICLTVGIALTAGVFSIVDAVLLEPLPYSDADRLALLWARVPEANKPRLGASQDEFDDYRRLTRSFECVAAAFPFESNLTGVERPERLSTALVTVNMLGCLGGSTIEGRDFAADEGEAGNQHRVLLSHRFWQRRYSGDPGVLGSEMRLDGQLHTIIGVLPPRFDLRISGRDSDLWLPLVLTPGQEPRGRRGLRVIVRLAEGVGMEEATEELEVLAHQFRDQYPDLYPAESGFGLWLAPLREELMGESLETTLWMLQGAVLLVLLIACANVTNLFLARAVARQRETAVRSALGAGRFELGANLLTESLILAGVSAVLGLLLAHGGLRLVIAWQGDYVYRLSEAGVDLELFAIAMLVALAAGAVCSLLPLVRLSRSELRESLADGARSPVGAGSGGRLRQGLVILEVAIAVVVVVVTGLLARSFDQLRSVDPGFDPENVLTARLYISPANYPEDAQQAALARRLTTAAREIPGVDAAGAISSLPLGQLRIRVQTEIEGRPVPEGQAGPAVDWRPVEPDYFAAMGIPLLDGRAFTTADRVDAAPVAIIGRHLAERYWPDQSPIGRRLKVPALSGGSAWAEVVGLVEHVKTSGLDTDAIEQLYTPFAQRPLPFLSLVLRSSRGAESLIGSLRQTVGSLVPDQPMDVRTMDDILADSQVDRRTVVFFMQALSVVSLLLAILGVYGVMAYNVALSHREYGVRATVGARKSDIFLLVLRRGLVLVAAGLVLGLVGAWAGARWLDSMLFEIKPLDAVSYLVAGAVIFFAAVAATVATARQATRVDTIEALRGE